MLKTPYIRSRNSEVTLADYNLLALKYLGIPFFESVPNQDSLNNNDPEFPAIAVYNGSLIFWDGTEWVQVGVGAGNVKRISLPSADYPDVIISADSNQLTVILGSVLSDYLSGFMPNPYVIDKYNQIYSAPAKFTTGVGGKITSFVFDIGGIEAGFKINFVA